MPAIVIRSLGATIPLKPSEEPGIKAGTVTAALAHPIFKNFRREIVFIEELPLKKQNIGILVTLLQLETCLQFALHFLNKRLTLQRQGHCAAVGTNSQGRKEARRHSPLRRDLTLPR
jgi:hypothetical protein